MEKDTKPKEPHKRLLKTSVKLTLISFLIIFVLEAILIYDWQHHKVSILNTKNHNLNVQLQYVQNEQNKLERQLK